MTHGHATTPGAPTVLAAAGLALALAGCGGRAADGRDCAAGPPAPGEARTCAVPGWPDRDFILRVPTRGDGPRPLLIAMHGAGGKKERFDAITCKDGAPADPSCLSAVAEARGVVLAFPDGTAHGLGGRSWNDGAPGPGWRCGPACEQHVDDVAYVRALIEEVARATPVDRARVYATGLSNGGGMSQRLACDLAGEIAAVAAVAGANRAAPTSGCAPARAVPVLAIHGDADRVWPFAGGASSLPFVSGRYPAAAAGITGGDGDPGWVARDGCATTPAERDLADADPADGTTSREQVWSGCAGGAEVAFITVRGGGHTWPGGDQYLGTRVVGPVARDLSASRVVLDFLLRFALPSP